MGGDLTAASQGLGRGTTMTFSIPLCVPGPGDAAAEGGQLMSCEADVVGAAAGGALAAPPSPTASLSPPATPSSLSPPSSPSSPYSPPAGAVSVLVAEDDPLSQKVMRKLLAALRLRFNIVGNGELAVTAYKQGARSAAHIHAPL